MHIRVEAPLGSVVYPSYDLTFPQAALAPGEYSRTENIICIERMRLERHSCMANVVRKSRNQVEYL